MFLQGLTISVGYTDYLSQIVTNRSQLDRWLIVTSYRDKGTISMCRREGLEFVESDIFYRNGATFNKRAALNLGLELLSDSGWVAVIDSDILLPPDFRGVVNEIGLEQGMLYGARRWVCSSREEFDKAKSSPVWCPSHRSEGILGYLQIFSLSAKPNRFEAESEDASCYDMAFSDSFAQEKRKILPSCVLHLGPIATNWQGRKSKAFLARNRNILGRGRRSSSLVSWIDESLEPACYNCVVIGFPDEALIRALARVSASLELWDTCGVAAMPPDRPAALYFSREILQLYEALRVKIRRGPSFRELEHYQQKIDILCICGQQSHTVHCELYSRVLPFVASNGLVMGTLISQAIWPTHTFGICLGLENPTITFSDNSWLLKSQQISNPSLSKSISFGTTKGFVGCLFAISKVDDFCVFLEMYSKLRDFWRGPVSVVAIGIRVPSAELVASKLGFGVVNVERPSIYARSALLTSLLVSPFERTLYLDLSVRDLGSVSAFVQKIENSDLFFVRRDEGADQIYEALIGIRRAFLREALASNMRWDSSSCLESLFECFLGFAETDPKRWRVSRSDSLDAERRNARYLARNRMMNFVLPRIRKGSDTGLVLIKEECGAEDVWDLHRDSIDAEIEASRLGSCLPGLLGAIGKRYIGFVSNRLIPSAGAQVYTNPDYADVTVIGDRAGRVGAEELSALMDWGVQLLKVVENWRIKSRFHLCIQGFSQG